MSKLKKQQQQKVSFQNFLTLFPEIELPLTLTTETHHEFSKHNVPIPLAMADKFLSTALDDEFTEYIACFKIPNTKNFHAVVCWRAGLMEYAYLLVTFEKNGQLIDKRTIGGTVSNGDLLTRSVATIDADWLITIVEGNESIKSGQSQFNPDASKVYSLELTADGEVIVAE